MRVNVAAHNSLIGGQMLQQQAIQRMTLGELQAKYMEGGPARMVRLDKLERVRLCCWDAASFLTVML